MFREVSGGDDSPELALKRQRISGLLELIGKATTTSLDITVADYGMLVTEAVDDGAKQLAVKRSAGVVIYLSETLLEIKGGRNDGQQFWPGYGLDLAAVIAALNHEDPAQFELVVGSTVREEGLAADLYIRGVYNGLFVEVDIELGHEQSPESHHEQFPTLQRVLLERAIRAARSAEIEFDLDEESGEWFWYTQVEALLEGRHGPFDSYWVALCDATSQFLT